MGHPVTFYSGDNPKQQPTNLFRMEVFKGQEFLEAKTMVKGNANYSNANVINNAKKVIAEKHGFTMNNTHMRTSDIFKDEQGALFFYKWFDDIGNVKTFLT